MSYSVKPFPLDDLALPALAIVIIGTVVTFQVTRRPILSLGIATLKSSVFLIYYGNLFSGRFTFLDDWTYVRRGLDLKNRGISVTNLFGHLPELFATGGGANWSYYLYNADSFRLFGEGYYAPVAMNVILTFAAAGLMAATVRNTLNYSRRLTSVLYVYTALHPAVIAWSTIMNGKDTLVLTCTALVVYAVNLIEYRRYVRAAALAFLAGMILLFTRFYIPFLMVSTLMLAFLLAPGNRGRLSSWLLILGAAGSIIAYLGADRLLSGYNQILGNFVTPLYGIPRMFLTPIPFNSEEAYAFLDLPQVIHWALTPVLFYGVIRLWRRRTMTARFVVIYFVLTLIFYGSFDELQGPRHRYQLEGLIALFQFVGLVGLLKKRFPGNSPVRGKLRPATERTA